MKCRMVRNRLVDLLDVACDTPDREALRAHLQTCPQCSNEFAMLKRAMESVRPKHRLHASPALKENVMNGVPTSVTVPDAPIREHRLMRLWRPVAAASMAAALLLAVSFAYWLVRSQGKEPLTAFSVFGQAVQAMQGLRSVHIEARMRTAPNDNFELILLNGEMVPIDLWKWFSEPAQWRVEKSGRVVVCDGETALLWIKNANVAAEAEAAASLGFIGWLAPLMDVEHVLDSEMQLAQAQGSSVTVEKGVGPDGTAEVIVYVEASAQGDYTNDWLLNKSIRDSDNLRVYRFDADTMWLKGLQVYVHTEDEDVLVFETVNIEYNTEFPETLFALDLPDDVSWYEPPAASGTAPATANLKPDEAAQAFFEACGRQDWDVVQSLYPIKPLPERLKKMLSGVKVLTIGTPFQSGQYRGWFVPYKIQLSNGRVIQFNLAVRNDNAAGTFMVDGGI